MLFSVISLDQPVDPAPLAHSLAHETSGDPNISYHMVHAVIQVQLRMRVVVVVVRWQFLRLNSKSSLLEARFALWH